MSTYRRKIPWQKAIALTSFGLLAVLVYVRYTQAVADAPQLDRLRYLTAGNLTLLLFVCAIAMLIAAEIQVHQERRRRVAAEGALRLANQEGETRIRARTKELLASNARVDTSEARLRLIADCGIVHLFTMNARGSTEYVTGGFATLTGLEPERVLEAGWMQAVHRDDVDRVRAAWEAGAHGALPFEVVFRLRADGAYRWFKMRAMPVTGDADHVEQWLGAAIDINDQEEIAMIRADLLKREQAARVEAELASRLKDDFLATISHELRTPLNAIVGWVHLLKVGIGDERDRAVAAIERNALAQARLIDDLLDVSRMVKGRVTLNTTTHDLRSSVQAALETIRPAADAKRVDLVVSAEGEVLVSGDAARLQQVVWNLVSNAVRFTPKDGRVSVEVGRVGSRARLRVTDTGEGIDPAFLPHVFEAFRQGGSRSARPGLGLGLAIVRQIVELHGGTVVAESEGLRRGSTFTVMLPIGDADRVSATGSAGRRVPAPSGLRVLVAEDDEDSAAMLGAILTHRGCEVRTTRNAHECLAVLEEWLPDVLVCDIGLPDDDGYSLLRRVRDRDRRPRPLPAVALTAFAREEDRARALSAGFAAHVSKPFDPEALFGEIVRAVTGPA